MIVVEYVGGPDCGKRESYPIDTRWVKTKHAGHWHLYEITDCDGKAVAMFVASRKVSQ